jgi:hypothetical protein
MRMGIWRRKRGWKLLNEDRILANEDAEMKLIVGTHNYYRHVYKVGDSHLAKVFVSMGHHVLYLSGPTNLFRLRYLLDRGPLGSEYRRVFGAWMRGGVYHSDKLLEYHPLSLVPISRRLPLGSTDLALFHNMTLTLPSVKRYIKKNGFAQPDVLLVSQLQMAELFDKVNARVKILRLTDNIPLFRNMPDGIKRLQKYALERADIVVVTSWVMRDRLSRIRQDTVCIPNAVDTEFYQSADRSLPSEYKGLVGPIVVYVGAIDYWYDVGLLQYLARQHPKVNFVLIGVPRVSLKPLYSFKNVHVLGARPYSEIPRYLWNAAVGIIPFKRLPLIESVNPVKLWEYLGCSLPVVSTRWEELERINSPALLADTYDEFTERLSQALVLASDETFKARCIKFAAGNTWENRAKEILRLVDSVKEAEDARSGN